MKRLASATLILGFLVACGKTEDTAELSHSTEPLQTEAAMAEAQPVVTLGFTEAALEFHDQAVNTLANTQSDCTGLFSDINSFVAAPSSELQLKAQSSFVPCLQSWRAAALYFQKPFSLAEAKDLYILTDLIDTRPFLPGYIDGIPDYPYSGLVHELDLPMDEGSLRSQHRLMDEDSAALGFPVIEFFLWRSQMPDVWIPNQPDKTINVTRRKQYLTVAAQVLQTQLDLAVMRWQDNQFDNLPERAQLNFILQSCQRLVMVDLLQFMFEETAITEPEWHHLAQISGQGRSYPIAMLESLQRYIGSTENPTAFTQWMNNNSELPVTTDALAHSIEVSIAAIQSLPENYPEQSEKNEQWEAARKSLAEVTLQFTGLMKHYKVPLLVE